MATEIIEGLVIVGTKGQELLNPNSLADFTKRQIIPLYLGVTDYENPGLKKDPMHEYIPQPWAEIPDVQDDTYIGNLFNFRYADTYMLADLSVSTKFTRETVLRALSSHRYNKFNLIPRFIPIVRGGRVTNMCQHNSSVHPGMVFDVRLTSFHFTWR